MVNKITNNDFNGVKGSEIALVDYSATWCGPCRMVAPVVEELSEEYAGKVAFFNADVDDNGALAQSAGITNIPALAIYKNGEKVAMKVGFSPKPVLKEWIDSVI